MVDVPAPTYLGPAKWHGPAENKPIRRIVIHATVSPCERGGARNIAAFFRAGSSKASAHYVVDPGEVVQVVWDSLVGYHAPPNEGSIGVELCDAMPTGGGVEIHLDRWHDDDHQAMLQRAARLVAGLCLFYNIPIRKLTSGDLLDNERGICGHVDVSRAWHQTSHWDPGTGFPWIAFIDMVEAAAVTLRRQQKEKPDPTPPPTRVARARAHLEAALAAADRPLRKARLRAVLALLRKVP